MKLITGLFSARINIITLLILLSATAAMAAAKLAPGLSQRFISDWNTVLEVSCENLNHIDQTQSSEIRVVSRCRGDVISVVNATNKYRAQVSNDEERNVAATDKIPLEIGRNIMEVKFSDGVKLSIEINRTSSISEKSGWKAY